MARTRAHVFICIWCTLTLSLCSSYWSPVVVYPPKRNEFKSKIKYVQYVSQSINHNAVHYEGKFARHSFSFLSWRANLFLFLLLLSLFIFLPSLFLLFFSVFSSPSFLLQTSWLSLNEISRNYVALFETVFVPSGNS